MSPRAVLAALTGRTPDTDEPDDIEQWVADLAKPDTDEPARIADHPAVNGVNTGGVL